MIKRMQAAHIDSVMEIWLSENISTHNYVLKDYWYSKFDEVKKSNFRIRSICLHR